MTQKKEPSPAFLFFCERWLRYKVLSMPSNLRGAYITLLALSFQENGIPDKDIQDGTTGTYCQITQEECEKVIEGKYRLKNGVWRNDFQETVRKRQLKKSKTNSQNAQQPRAKTVIAKRERNGSGGSNEEGAKKEPVFVSVSVPVDVPISIKEKALTTSVVSTETHGVEKTAEKPKPKKKKKPDYIPDYNRVFDAWQSHELLVDHSRLANVPGFANTIKARMRTIKRKYNFEAPEIEIAIGYYAEAVSEGHYDKWILETFLTGKRVLEFANENPWAAIGDNEKRERKQKKKSDERYRRECLSMTEPSMSQS